MTSSDRTAVLIAIPTFRRVDLLTRLLIEVRRQIGESALDARIVVVDNDPDESAATIAVGADTHYVNEPRPGIGFARRTALAEARAGELVVMIDDDVFPESGWLVSLVRAWKAHRAVVTVGYVRYVWPSGCDPWIVAGGFMRRSHLPTGTPLGALSTGSVLIDADAVRALGIDFDTRRGLAGGEDSLFGADILRAGGSIVSCAESVARDEVPQERATIAFVKRRTIGQGSSLVALRLTDTTGLTRAARRLCYAGGAMARMVVFEAMHLAGRATHNLRMDAVGKRRLWFAIGRFRGAVGRQIDEYSRR